MNREFTPYTGPASHRHPNTYKGREQSGGYLARNQKPSSSNSPSFKGRIWVPGAGWFWVSGWTSESHRGQGQYLSLKLSPMSDQDADKYCQPKAARQERGHENYAPPSQGQRTNEYRDSDIPF